MFESAMRGTFWALINLILLIVLFAGLTFLASPDTLGDWMNTVDKHRWSIDYEAECEEYLTP